MKFASIQALRAVAILLVIGSHTRGFENALGLHTAFINLIPFEATGVDLFFIISGFVMMYIHWDDFAKGRSLNFLVKRIVRIFPMYWIVTGVLALVFALYPQVVHHWESAHASLWMSLLLIPQNTQPLLYVGWTLVSEMYFYYVFTAFLAASRRTAWYLIGGWTVMLLIAQFFHFDDIPWMAVVFKNLSIEFIFGVCIAGMIKSGYFRFATPAVAAGLVLLSITAVIGLQHEEHWLMDEHLRFVMAGIPMALIVYGLAALEVQGHLRVPRPLQDIGDASYSIYLTHGLSYVALGRLLPLMLKHHLMLLVIVPVFSYVMAVLVGITTYRVLEKPLLKRLNGVYVSFFPKQRIAA